MLIVLKRTMEAYMSVMTVRLKYLTSSNSKFSKQQKEGFKLQKNKIFQT